jgi:hypothetical protein
MIVLMIAGAAFACAGLYMMLRPKPEGAAKIELFGLKFESSSAGLLVFIVGAAFLAVTLFVPEKPSATPRTSAMERPDDEDGPSREVAPEIGSDTPAPEPGFEVTRGDLRKAVVESEPNNTINDAQVLLPGQRATGAVKYRDSDWFVVPDGTALVGQEIKLRRLSDRGELVVTAYDAREQVFREVKVAQNTAFLEVDRDPGDRLYLRVLGNSSFEGRYEIIMATVTSN